MKNRMCKKMKKNNRKLIAAIVLALALVLAAACALAAQSGDVIEGKMIWELSDSGILTITGEGAIPDYDDTTKAPWDAYKTSIT